MWLALKRIIRPKIRHRKENTREYRLMKFISEKVLPNEPFIYGGYYSWLIGERNEPLQIDIFYPQLSFARGRPLAIEVQSDLHRGEWSRKLKKFFKTEGEFEHRLRNDAIKKEILQRRGIPFLEIWPEDPFDEALLRQKISELLQIELK